MTKQNKVWAHHIKRYRKECSTQFHWPENYHRTHNISVSTLPIILAIFRQNFSKIKKFRHNNCKSIVSELFRVLRQWSPIKNPFIFVVTKSKTIKCIWHIIGVFAASCLFIRIPLERLIIIRSFSDTFSLHSFMFIFWNSSIIFSTLFIIVLDFQLLFLFYLERVLAFF